MPMSSIQGFCDQNDRSRLKKLVCSAPNLAILSAKGDNMHATARGKPQLSKALSPSAQAAILRMSRRLVL